MATEWTCLRHRSVQGSEFGSVDPTSQDTSLESSNLVAQIMITFKEVKTLSFVKVTLYLSVLQLGAHHHRCQHQVHADIRSS